MVFTASLPLSPLVSLPFPLCFGAEFANGKRPGCDRRAAQTFRSLSLSNSAEAKVAPAHLGASQGGNNTMLRLTPPRHVTFFISIAVAVIAVIIHYAKIDIPHVHSGFVILLIGYLVLVAGNVLDGV